MSKYATLIAQIAANIRRNGAQAITGNLLQEQLLAMITSLGEYYQFGGLVSQDTEFTPGDEPVVFIAATPGTYTDFGGLVVADGEVALLVWSGSAWSKQTPDIATRSEVSQLGQKVTDLEQGVLGKYSLSFKYGGILTANGQEYSTIKRVCTGFLSAFNGVQITANHNLFNVFKYDANFGYLGADNAITWDDNTSDTLSFKFNGYIRIVMRKDTADSNISPSEIDDFAGMVSFVSLSTMNERIEAIEKEVGGNFYNIDYSLQLGGLVLANGVFYSTNTRVVSSFISAKEGIFIKSNHNLINVFKYNDEKVYLGESEVITWINNTEDSLFFKYDGYIRFVLRKDTSDSIILESEVESFKTRVEIVCGINGELDFLEDKTSAIGSRTFNLPDYWYQYIVEKTNSINDKNESLAYNGDSFVFITDIHLPMNYGHSMQLIKYIKRNSNIANVIFGGDIMPNVDESTGLSILKDFNSINKDVKMFSIRGNHDNNSHNEYKRITDSQLYYNAFKNRETHITNRSGFNYCIDNDAQKIRYVIVDTGWKEYDYSSEEVFFTSSGSDVWMKERLTEKNSEWTILVIAHQFFMYKSASDPSDLNLCRSGVAIKNAIDEVYNNINANFVGVLCGHCHRDYFERAANGYIMVSTTCDANGERASAWDSNYPNRVEGTTTEQAFDTVFIDKTNRKLCFIRVGVGVDREYTY